MLQACGSYVCECCRRTFNTDRSDAEAIAEAVAEGMVTPGEELVRVCDDCYLRIKAWREREGLWQKH